MRSFEKSRFSKNGYPFWSRVRPLYKPDLVTYIAAAPKIAGLIAPAGACSGLGEAHGRAAKRAELIYETAVITGGMAPIALLALALLS